MHALKIENIPFYQACKKGHTNILQLLLKNGVDKKKPALKMDLVLVIQIVSMDRKALFIP